MRVTREKNCYCFKCKKSFHYLGIAQHRMKHKRLCEDVEIAFTYGDIIFYEYSKLKKKGQNEHTK